MDSPDYGPVMRSFEVSFLVSLNKHSSSTIAGDLRRHATHVTSQLSFLSTVTVRQLATELNLLETKVGRRCKICRIRDVCRSFISCNHQVLCAECTPTQCPVCGKRGDLPVNSNNVAMEHWVCCFSRHTRLSLTLHIWDKESIGLKKSTEWPFHDHDLRSRLWHRSTPFRLFTR